MSLDLIPVFGEAGPRRNVIKVSKVRRHTILNWFSHDHFLLLVFLSPALLSARLSPFHSRVPTSRIQDCLCRRASVVHSTSANSLPAFTTTSLILTHFWDSNAQLRTKSSERARDSTVDPFQNPPKGPHIEKLRHDGSLLAITQQPEPGKHISGVQGSI